MKKTLFFALVFMAFSNLSFGINSEKEFRTITKKEQSHYLINKTLTNIDKTDTKKEKDGFEFCYEVGRETTSSHGVSITRVKYHCTYYEL